MTNEEALKWLDEYFVGNMEAKAVVSKALKKRIPIKPKDKLISPLFPSSHWWVCPVCGNDVEVDDGRIDIKELYCDHCGQAIDWAGEEK